MSWSLHFDTPVPLPDGRLAKTLHDARDYILNLPKSKQADKAWLVAAENLLKAAELGGPWTIFARMGMMHAIMGPTPIPDCDPEKQKIHEFRNYKKRDPWR